MIDVAATNHNLARAIDALSPDQAGAQVTDLLRQGSLVGMVVNDPESGLVLLRSVESTIGKVGQAGIRGNLGYLAVGVTVDALNSRYLYSYDGSTAARLAEQATRLAELTENPRDRALSLLRISKVVSRRADKYAADDIAAGLVWHSNAALGQAAEGAADIASASDRANTLAWIAEGFADNIERLGDRMPEDDAGQQGLLAALARRPAQLYQEALAATNDVKQPSQSYEQRGRMVVSMAKSAAAVSNVSPELAKYLVKTTAREIDNVLDAYDEGGRCSYLLPAQKCQALVDLGSYLARAIDEEFRPPRQADALRQRPVDKLTEVFGHAGAYAQQVRRPRLLSPFSNRSELLKSSSFSARTAAGRMIRTDFAAGQELLEISFDLAAAEDKHNESDGRRKDEVLQAISGYAENQDTVKSGFELFALAHELESRGRPEDRVSRRLEVNARTFISYLFQMPYQEVALDEIDREFVEFSVAVALNSTSNGALYRLNALRSLGRYVGEPDLQAYIGRHVDDLAGQERARQLTKSQVTGS